MASAIDSAINTRTALTTMTTTAVIQVLDIPPVGFSGSLLSPGSSPVSLTETIDTSQQSCKVEFNWSTSSWRMAIKTSLGKNTAIKRKTVLGKKEL